MLRLVLQVLRHHRREVGVVVQGLLRAGRPRLAGGMASSKRLPKSVGSSPWGGSFFSRSSFGPAPPLPGRSPVRTDPRFAAALQAWLADDEANALPAFAALAAEDNRAAQVLLALIDRVPVYQGPWLVGLDRKERLALTRAPGGLSGRSWMVHAAADTPLAALWLERDGTETSLETPLALAGMGENRAARETLQALAARQYRGFAAAASDPRFPPELRHLVWREWAETPRAARGPRRKSRRFRRATRKSAASRIGR